MKCHYFERQVLPPLHPHPTASALMGLLGLDGGPPRRHPLDKVAWHNVMSIYAWPDNSSYDYDPYRKQVLSQEEWKARWRAVMRPADVMTIGGDEIIIKKK